jgi:hypothetical protein
MVEFERGTFVISLAACGPIILFAIAVQAGSIIDSAMV